MLLAFLLAAAAPAPPPPFPGERQCAKQAVEGMRAIDWWLGDWQISDDATDTLIGYARVAPWPADPCQLREDVTLFDGQSSFDGALVTTLSFDKKAPNYRQLQVWPDGHGEFLWGALGGDRLVLSSIIGQERLRWTLARTGAESLRLTLERSHDEGVSWGAGPVRTLTYRRAPRPAP